MSEGPLEPAHDAVAEVFCDIEDRHLIQVGIAHFFGDLLGPSYASVFAIDHELISVGRLLLWQGTASTSTHCRVDWVKSLRTAFRFAHSRPRDSRAQLAQLARACPVKWDAEGARGARTMPEFIFRSRGVGRPRDSSKFQGVNKAADAFVAHVCGHGSVRLALTSSTVQRPSWPKVRIACSSSGFAGFRNRL